MSADLSWLDAKATRLLIDALDKGCIDFRFVGGAVRDGLLGRPVSDIDVATSAKPDAVIRALEAAGLKAVPTGIAHGTVTAVAAHRPFEITTLRRDVETDGRRATVAFTDDWRADAERRDFTMNALYADRDGAITDFFGGEADARAGRVRFIGDARQRIAEDGLRILRFFRFQARYGIGPLDSEGLAACAELVPMIARLSGERVRVELFKTLTAPDPAPVWRAMIDAGVMAQALPAAADVGALSRMIALEIRLGLLPDPIRRLAALTGMPSPEVAATVKSRLRLSNRDADHYAAFRMLRGRAGRVTEGKFGEALYGAHPTWVRDAAMLAAVEEGQPLEERLDALSRFLESWTQPRFPVTGADLKAAGLATGPAIGRLLAEIERWWIAAGFRPDRAACLERLKQISGSG